MSTGDLTAPSQPTPTSTPAAEVAAAPEAGAGLPPLRGINEAEVTPDLSGMSPELAATVRANPRLLDAVRYQREFPPQEGFDYEWLVEYAEKRLEQALETYQSLDDKATSIVTHLGSGTGLLALGAIATVSATGVPREVAVAAIFPFVAAVGALCFAVAARRTRDTAALPSPKKWTGYAEARGDEKAAKADLIGYYNLSYEILTHHARCRAWNIDWALRLLVLAVGLLAVPLGATVCFKNPPPAPIGAASP